MTVLAFASLFAWLYLALLHGGFWRVRPVLCAVPVQPRAAGLPVRVTAIVPARDEAETIARALASLTGQRTAALLDVICVDDESADGTGEIAGRDPLVRVIRAAPRPAGWSGKLHALSQGVEHATGEWLLFADADIVHDPAHLDALLAVSAGRDMVSGMVTLRAHAPAERWIVPAFVYFFAMIFPFGRVNGASGVAAAAGGTVLIRAAALARLGGIAAIRGALIDDVALAAAAKRHGRVALYHDPLARSVRAYPRAADLWAMIARTAFVQLRYSALRLAVSLAGLALLFWVPVLTVIHWPGACAWALMAITFVPMLRHYALSPLRALVLPAIATFFMAATIGSALDHWRGRGVRWKSRAYAA